MTETAIKIENVSKQYKLGSIGGSTLKAELQSFSAKMRGKEDPNLKIGDKEYIKGTTFWALQNIDIEIHKGEAVGIIGHNGAGKSTLLKLLCRVTAPTDGAIYINGKIASMLEVGTGFHPELTGRENIYMNGAILGMSKKEVDAKIDEIIDFSECGDFIDTPVKRYSSGMYVKLAFAVAAYLDADIMVMDEVLAVGDVKFQKKCLGKMGDAANYEGKTVLYVSHNMNTIRQLCNRCIVLNHGRIAFDGDVESAIACYLGMASDEKPVVLDFSNVNRPSFEFGTKIKILGIEFIDKKEAIFLSNEKIVFDIKYKAMTTLEDVYFRLEVSNMDSTPVGMAESVCINRVNSIEEGVFRFSWTPNNLVAGNYQIDLDVYTSNEFGTFSSYDHPLKKIIIEIIEDTKNGRKSYWDKNAWNSVRLNQVMLEDYQ